MIKKVISLSSAFIFIHCIYNMQQAKALEDKSDIGSFSSDTDIRNSYDEHNPTEKRRFKSKNKEIQKELESKSIAIKAETLEELKNDPENTIIKVDLFDEANLAHTLYSAIKYMTDMTEEYESNKNEYMNDDNKKRFMLPEKLVNDKNLLDELNELVRRLKKLSEFNKTDFSDESFSKAYNNVLGGVFGVLAKAKSGEHDNGRPLFDEKHYFMRFLNTATKALELLWMRDATEKTLSKLRVALEGEMGSKKGNNSSSITIHIPSPIPSMKINLEKSIVNETYGMTASSLYSVSSTNSGKASVSLGFDLGKIATAKVGAGLGYEQISTDIFYSLEQVIDSYNNAVMSKIAKSRLSNIKEAAKGRKNMQRQEKELLALMDEFEGLLKIFKVLPNDVVLNWVDITRSNAVDKSKETAGLIDASADISATAIGAGISLKESILGSKVYSKDYSLLSLINEDCSTASGSSVEDCIITIIGKEFDFSGTLPTANLLYGHLNTYLGVLTELANVDDKEEEKKLEKKKRSCEEILCPKKKIGSYGRVGVFKTCIATAAQLKELDIHDKYKTQFKQIYILLEKLAKFEEFSKNKSGIRKLVGHGEKSSGSSLVTAKTSNFQANVNASVVKIGDFIATFNRKTLSGSPFKEENGKYMTLKFLLPISSVGGGIMVYMREKASSAFVKVASKISGGNCDDFVDVSTFINLNAQESMAKAEACKALKQAQKKKEKNKLHGDERSDEEITGEAIEKYLANTSLSENAKESIKEKVVKEISAEIVKSGIARAVALGTEILLAATTDTQSDVKAYGTSEFTYTFRYVEPIANAMPLPGYDVAINRKSGKWVLDSLNVANLLYSNIASPASIPASVKYKGTFGTQLKRTGPDTLHDIISKSNAFMLGLEDNKSGVSTAYEALKKGQACQLLKIFKNINNPDSNAAYELQTMYNEILSSKNVDIEKCKNVFRRFLTECKKLQTSDSAEDTENAPYDDSKEIALFDHPDEDVDAVNSGDQEKLESVLKVFDEIVLMNYKYSFKPAYDEAYSRKAK